MSRHEDAGAGHPDVPSDAAIRAARERVEAVLDEHDLSLDDPAMWLEPAASMPAELLEAAQPPAPARATPRWATWSAVAAVVIVLLGAALLAGRDRPDWTVETGPTDEYPAASATIDGWNEGNGTRMVLTMRGVDPAPEGFFYEMWMSEGPVHISAGTFSEVERIELRAAVSRRDYPRLWVTLEPIDDDESPTSVVVIDTE